MGFGNHHFGYSIVLSSLHYYLLTWKTMVEGRTESIHVWQRTKEFRNVFLNHSTRIKTSCSIQLLKNILYEEIYGDLIQALHIMDCHNRATGTSQNRQIKEHDSVTKSYAPIVFEGNYHNLFL